MLYVITRQALESRSHIKSFLSCLQWDYFSIKNALVLFVFPPHDILMCEITTASPSTGWSGKQSYLGHMPISSRISGLLGCVIDSSRPRLHKITTVALSGSCSVLSAACELCRGDSNCLPTPKHRLVLLLSAWSSCNCGVCECARACVQVGR